MSGTRDDGVAEKAPGLAFEKRRDTWATKSEPTLRNEGWGTRKGEKQIPRDFVDAQKLLMTT